MGVQESNLVVISVMHVKMVVRYVARLFRRAKVNQTIGTGKMKIYGSY